MELWEIIESGADSFEAYNRKFPQRNLTTNLENFMKAIKDAYFVSKIKDTDDIDTKRLFFHQLSKDADLTELLPKMDDENVIDCGQIDFLIGVMTGEDFLKRVTLHQNVKDALEKFVAEKLG